MNERKNEQINVWIEWYNWRCTLTLPGKMNGEKGERGQPVPMVTWVKKDEAYPSSRKSTKWGCKKISEEI